MFVERKAHIGREEIKFLVKLHRIYDTEIVSKHEKKRVGNEQRAKISPLTDLHAIHNFG